MVVCHLMYAFYLFLSQKAFFCCRKQKIIRTKIIQQCKHLCITVLGCEVATVYKLLKLSYSNKNNNTIYTFKHSKKLQALFQSYISSIAHLMP